jgi:hypothetical protein
MKIRGLRWWIVALLFGAALWMLDDPALKPRMREIAVSHADAVFARNPRLAAALHRPDLGFGGIERDWAIGYDPDVCACLELCRGSISCAPGSDIFSLNLDSPYRHMEGWVNYGASWCLSLAYFEFNRRIGKVL